MLNHRLRTSLLAAILMSCAILAAAPGHTGQPKVVDAKDVETAAVQWLAAINAGDNETGRKGLADDAAVIGPAGPIAFGRAEIDAQIAAITRIPGFHVDFTPERSGLSADGRIGFVVGQSSISMIKGDGQREPQTQRLLLIWRLDEAGKWKCIFNVPMGEAPPSSPAP